MAFPVTHSSPDLQFAFLSILPRIEKHGRIYFRHLRCPETKADAVGEMVALSWRWFVRLAQRGKDATQFPSVLATFAARAVRSGRRLCGKEKAKDVLSPEAQRRHGFVVTKLPDVSTLHGSPLDEALRDNTRSEVPEQVAFRLDFPAWRLTRTDRDRRVIDDMMAGEGTMALADRYGLSPARVSQLRREFHADWQTFCGERTELSHVASTR
jgi:hypothetical protein